MAVTKKPTPAIVKPAAPTGTALKKWDEEMAAYAAEATKSEESVSLGKFVSTKSGVLSFNGAPVPGNKMNVIVVDSVLENQYYEDDFDPDAPSAPVCFAFGRSDDEMAPHEKAIKKQHESCDGCPQNEWASAAKGKGKACKNVRRLALITEDALEDVAAAELAFMKVPVMSVKGWAGYVGQLKSALNRPPFAVVTEISLVPDPKSQFRVQFKLVEQVTDPIVGAALLEKHKLAREAIGFPYLASEREAPPPRPAGRNAKFARK